MENSSFALLRPDLIALGFGFYGSSATLAPDPEKTILSIIRLFDEEVKVFHMLLAWVERFGDLLHVERFSALSSGLSGRELIILGVLAQKRVSAGDYRFRSLAQKIMKLAPSSEKPWPGQGQYLIEKNGVDPEFKLFGVTTSRFLPSETKKLLERSWILKKNLWFRLRALLGANFRADIAYLRLSGLAKNAYVAMKLLKCAKETSYRLWGQLDEADVEGMISVS